MGAPPDYHPKTPPPNTVTLGVRASPCKLCRGWAHCFNKSSQNLVLRTYIINSLGSVGWLGSAEQFSHVVMCQLDIQDGPLTCCQLMTVISWELSWSCQRKGLQVASPCDLRFSKHELLQDRVTQAQPFPKAQVISTWPSIACIVVIRQRVMVKLSFYILIRIFSKWYSVIPVRGT